MPRRHHESIGDYISSACFGGVAFIAFVNGIEAYATGNTLRSIAIWMLSFRASRAISFSDISLTSLK